MIKKLLQIFKKIICKEKKQALSIEYIQDTAIEKKKVVCRCLVCDNGGIKMLSTKDILSYLEKLCHESKMEFDLVAGSGAGAIIAAAIACNEKIQNTFNYVLTNIDDIFREEKHNFFKKLDYKYSPDSMHRIIKESIKSDWAMKDAKTPLLISAYDAGERRRRFFSSFNEYKDVKISDCVTASCSSLGLFSPYEMDGKAYISDNIVSCGPLLASLKALKEHYKNADEFRILSITGNENDVTEKYNIAQTAKCENLRCEIQAIKLFDNVKLLRVNMNDLEKQNNFEIDSFDKHCILNLLKYSENNAVKNQKIIRDFLLD